MRLFVAVEISSEVKEIAVSIQRMFKSSGIPIRCVRPENIHLTLKFLGNVEEKRGSHIDAALLNSVRQKDHFELRSTHIGAFPDLNSPRVLWLGLEDKSGDLAILWETVETELIRIGFEKERKAPVPHITIGRMKSFKEKEKIRAIVTSCNKKIASGTSDVSGIHLIKSRLHPEGAIYSIVKSFGFK